MCRMIQEGSNNHCGYPTTDKMMQSTQLTLWVDEHSEILQNGQITLLPQDQHQLQFHNQHQHQHQHPHQQQHLIQNMPQEHHAIFYSQTNNTSTSTSTSSSNNNSNSNNNFPDNDSLAMESIAPSLVFNYKPDDTGTADANVTPAATADGATTADASPVEEIPDSLENEESFKYLEELNSDNLMQFSQQTAVEELMQKEHLTLASTENFDIKPNLNVLPTIEEHDIGGYKFDLNWSATAHAKGKSNWVYSEDLNKVYIRMNEVFSIDAIFTPKTPQIALRLRVLLCFVKAVSDPVLRCQNHISKDMELQPTKRVSLLRCENPNTEYCGKAEGKSIMDRYSVLVPLNMTLQPGSDNSIKQTIALKFACQNSCIGRKETSIIFLLESMNGEILSQRVLDIKICSCPKRDKTIDERNHRGAAKRKLDDDGYPGDVKVQRQCSTSPNPVKEELSSSDLEEDSSDAPHTTHSHCQLQSTAHGTYRLVLELDNKETVLRVIHTALSNVALNMTLYPGHQRRYKRKFERLLRLYRTAQKYK